MRTAAGEARRSRRSWKEKLRPDMRPKVCVDPKGRGRMLVPTPMQVAAEIARVRRGQLLRVSELQKRMAARSGADWACPLTTGIFLSIVAGAANDDETAGRRPLAPYWRIVRDDGTLSKKLPPGVARQVAKLRAEGHSVGRIGTTWQVRGFQEPAAARRRRARPT